MQYSATLKNVRTSAQKVRIVADEIRGKSVEKAIDVLTFSTKKASALLKKTLNSALSNAEHNAGADIDSLIVQTVYVNEGPRIKRFHARARGRGNQIVKRLSHITVTLSD